MLQVQLVYCPLIALCLLTSIGRSDFLAEEVEFSGKLAEEYSRRYAATGDAAIYSRGTSLTTDKTNEFRLNICPINGPENDHRITVDRHIADGGHLHHEHCPE